MSSPTPIAGQKVIFFGNERLATGITTTAPTLRGLIDHGYEVAAIVVNYTAAQSRTAASRELEVIKVAEAHNIPVLSPKKLSDITEELRTISPTVGVLLAYGRIIPQSILELFPCGIVNIHPSLLPLHRGSMPIEGAILEGASETGVSLMRLEKEMDAGPIYAQGVLSLSGQESKQEVYDDLLELGNAMLFECLPGILNGSIAPQPQDHEKATYDQLLTKDDGVIDWKKSAERIEREIRAYLDWPKSRTQLAGKDVVITKAHVVQQSGEAGTANISGKELIVCCGNNALSIDILKPAGKNEMTSEAFLAGHKHLFS
jgi:methionyl-tRNA formyltransferase